MKSGKGIHDHHRERMRERIRCGGLSSFAEHELLEMLLYYSIPRGDTNELAHVLMERFGGFNEIIEANFDDLLDVKGIGDSSAILVKLIEEVIRRYVSLYTLETTQYNHLMQVVEYIWPRFLGLNREHLYLMLFSNKMEMIDCALICEGTVNSAKLQPRIIFEKAFRKNAATAILAHNHPHGVVTPSESDVEMTKMIFQGLSMIGVPLLEHVVFAENLFLPIIKYHPEIKKIRDPSIAARVQTAIQLDMDEFYRVDLGKCTFYPFMEPLTEVEW